MLTINLKFKRILVKISDILALKINTKKRLKRLNFAKMNLNRVKYGLETYFRYKKKTMSRDYEIINAIKAIKEKVFPHIIY